MDAHHTGFQPEKSKKPYVAHPLPTSGVSLQEQDPYNNVVRTAFEAMSAVLGGTQSLHTNSFDEAVPANRETSARIARNTQLILQHETGVTNVVDTCWLLLCGSAHRPLAKEAWKLIEEVEAAGGCFKSSGRRPAKGTH